MANDSNDYKDNAPIDEVGSLETELKHILDNTKHLMSENKDFIALEGLFLFNLGFYFGLKYGNKE